MIRFTLACLALAGIVLVYVAAAGTIWALPLGLLALAAGLVLVMEHLA